MSAPVVQLKEILTESKMESNEPDVGKRLRVRLNCTGVEKRPDTNDKAGATKYYTRRSGQFIYGRQNLHKGAFGVIPEHLDGFESSADIPAFDVSPSCKPEWIDLFLKQGGYYLELAKLASGVGSQRISPTKFLNLEIPLPTISEQELILRKVGGLLSNQGQLFGELIHQQTLLKKLRQQILQEAIEGKLTADWRAANPNVEPANELLKRIATEKAELVKAKKIKKQKPLPPISDDEKPFELPEGWAWCRFGDVLESTFYGPRFGKSEYVENGIPTIRTTDMDNGIINFDNPPSVDVTDQKKINLYKLLFNDLLVTRTGSIGTMALYQSDTLAFPSAYLIRCRFVIPHMADFLYKYLHSPMVLQYFGLNTKTGSRPNINAVSISNSLPPLPPLDELQSIVTKVEKLLAICDQLETQITQNQTHADALMQAVLRDAFTKDPTDTANA